MMSIRGSRDFLGAGLVAGGGLFACLYSLNNYAMGALSAPGPGLFPAIVGGLMAVCGCIMGVQAFLQKRKEEGIRFEARQLALVLLSIAVFAMIVQTTGYGPAVFVLVMIASFADNALGLREKLVLAAVLSVVAIVLFRLILQVHLPVFFKVW